MREKRVNGWVEQNQSAGNSYKISYDIETKRFKHMRHAKSKADIPMTGTIPQPETIDFTTISEIVNIPSNNPVRKHE